MASMKDSPLERLPPEPARTQAGAVDAGLCRHSKPPRTRYIEHTNIAEVHAALGDMGCAMAALDRA
jgi:hypothetical protein